MSKIEETKTEKKEEIPKIENLKITTTLNVKAVEFVPFSKTAKSLLQGLNTNNRKDVKKDLATKKAEEVSYAIYERGVTNDEYLYDLVELYKELIDMFPKDSNFQSSFLSNISEDFKNRKDSSPKRVLGNAKFIRTLFKQKLYSQEDFISNIKLLGYETSDLIYFDIFKDFIPKDFILKKHIASYDNQNEKSYDILLSDLKSYITKDNVKEVAKEVYKRAVSDENVTVDMADICNDLFSDKNSPLFKEFKVAILDLAKGDYTNRKKKPYQRSIGNIILLGELFTRSFIPIKVISSIIEELTGYDPLETELLYNLLYSVGALFDENKDTKEQMDKFIEKLVRIMDNDDTPPQTKSLIQNILFLRGNNWEEIEEEDEEDEDEFIEGEDDEDEEEEGTDYEKYRSEFEEYKKSLGQ